MKSLIITLVLITAACTNGNKSRETISSTIEPSHVLSDADQGCDSEIELLRNFLNSVNALNPESDAIRDFNEGREQFIAIIVLAPELPGIPQQEEEFYITKYAHKYVEGISDFICNDEHSRLIDEVISYVEAYNIALRSMVDKKSIKNGRHERPTVGSMY